MKYTYYAKQRMQIEKEENENIRIHFDIDSDLIIDLYNRVNRHLNAIWWNPEDAVENGKIINRPN